MTSETKKLSYEELERQCSTLKTKLIVSEKEIERLTILLTDVTTDRNWTRGLLENMSIPIREKVVLYGAWRVLRKKKGEVRPDGLTHVYRSDISKFTGLTENQVGDGLKKLKDHGIIDRKIESSYDRKTGKHEKHNLMALGDLASENPKAIDFSAENNWGGKREKKTCTNCGHTEFVVHTRKECTCTSCGQSELDENWKTLNEHTENNSEEENNSSSELF